MPTEELADGGRTTRRAPLRPTPPREELGGVSPAQARQIATSHGLTTREPQPATARPASAGHPSSGARLHSIQPQSATAVSARIAAGVAPRGERKGPSHAAHFVRPAPAYQPGIVGPPQRARPNGLLTGHSHAKVTAAAVAAAGNHITHRRPTHEGAAPDERLRNALQVVEVIDALAGIPKAAGSRASTLSAALRQGSSAAGRALPEAGRFARAVGADTPLPEAIGRAAPIASLGLTYVQSVAAGDTPNEAMAKSIGALAGSEAGEAAALIICTVPGVGTLGCVVAVGGAGSIGAFLGQEAGSAAYHAAVWIGHEF